MILEAREVEEEGLRDLFFFCVTYVKKMLDKSSNPLLNRDSSSSPTGWRDQESSAVDGCPAAWGTC